MSGLLAGFIAANAASPLRANTKSEEINRIATYQRQLQSLAQE
jgi:hypothetical protein